MTRTKVGHWCFFSSKFVYNFVCFLGCALQITEISINYFKFQVVSNLRVTMPGKEMMRAINICFQNHQVIDYWKYREIVDAKTRKNEIPAKLGADYDKEQIVQYYLTMRERLEITMNPDQLFEPNFPPRFSTKFTLSEYICYHMSTDGEQEFETEWGVRPLSVSWYAEYRVMPILLKNVTILHIVMSPVHQPPFIEFFLKPRIENFDWKNPVQYYSTAHSFKDGKLEWPYVDNCINYPKLGFKDKRDAINSCINEKSIAKFGRTARFKEFDNVTAVDYPMAYYPWHENGTIMSVQFSVECKKIYHRANCELETSFTKTTIVRGSSPHFKFYQSMCEDPSYDIQSQPKIQNVDYVTYIFGAFGTWFGFSFILFNPVKYFLEVKNHTVRKSAPIIRSRREIISQPQYLSTFDSQRVSDLKKDLGLVLIQFNQSEIERKRKEAKCEEKITAQNLQIQDLVREIKILSQRIDRR